MSTPTFRVTTKTDPLALVAFIRSTSAKGCSGHFADGQMVWLLKPTSKGGRTIGRVFVSDNADTVWESAWAQANGSTT